MTQRRIYRDGARLEVYKVGNTSTTPDFTIGAATGDLEAAEIETTLGPLKDQASFTVSNFDGKYVRGTNTIVSGDRVEYWVNFEGQSGWTQRFTGVAKPPKVSGEGSRDTTMKVKVQDFVGAIMSFRTVEAGFNQRQLAGTSDSVLNWVLAEECPEIDRSGIDTVSKQGTFRFNAKNVLDAVSRIVAQAGLQMWSDGRTLIARELSGVTQELALGDHDYGTFEFETSDDALRNFIRLDGGSVLAPQDIQTDQSAYTTVTESNHILRQIFMPKSIVSQIDLWTDSTRLASGDGVTVRLQHNVNGLPENVEDSTKDETRKTLPSEFLADAGYTSFDMPENEILDSDPWMIIEGDGEGDGTGQDIGTNATGVPTYKAYYPFPVSNTLDDKESIERYRRRELQLQDETLESYLGVDQHMRTIMEQRNVVERDVSFDARSPAAFALTPGDGVFVDLRGAGLNDDFVVSKVKESYRAGSNVVATDVTLRSIDSAAAIGGIS